MSITLNALQKQRRDTAANWTTANPTLLAGEIGLESDTGYWKVGDGSTAWTSLAYVSGLGAEIPVSRLADGSARQLLQTAANGTDVEWTSNVDVPGTLDVTGAATFDAAVTIQGNLTVNGTTTNINTQNLVVEDKNIIVGDVATPTDVTADGGGITLKGTTDKTINWVDATDAWTLSEHVSIASGKEYRINGTKVLDATSLGSGVLITSSNITDGTIVNADINASAAIAGTKISPDFGSQNTTTTGTVTGASLIPSSSTAPSNGVYLPAANTVGISTASTERIRIGSAGQIGIGGANYGTSGQVLTSNGSGAAPSWQTSTNQWTTSGSNIYYSTGSVGIGTTNPSYLLTASASSTSTTLNDSAHWTAAVQNTGAATANQLNSLLFRFADGTYNGNSVISALRESGTGRQQSLIFAPSNSSGDPTERLRITSAGLVGIGTSVPSQLLHVSGGQARVSTSPKANSNTFLTLGTTDASNPMELIFGNSTNSCWTIQSVEQGTSVRPLVLNPSGGNVGIGITPSEKLHVDGGRGRFSSSSNNLDVYHNGSVAYLETTGGASTPLAFANGGLERARIDTSGRLLVGTSSARTGVFFNGDANTNPLIQVEKGGDGAATASCGISITRNVNNSSSAAPYLLFAKSTGTTSGSVTSVSSGDSLGLITFQGADGTDFPEAASIRGEVDGTPGSNDMPGRLVFSVTADGASSPTEAMRISNNRNVRFGTSGTSYGMFDINNDGSSTYKLEYTNVSGTRVFGVTSGGIVESRGSFDSSTVSAANVFINASTYQLQRSISSIKYKKDVETIEDRYSDALLQCRPVWYRSKCENDNPAWGHWGFIAEEVAEIDPRLCHYGKDENGADVIESVQYDRFVPHLLNLIKRQQQAIEILEAKVAALESA